VISLYNVEFYTRENGKCPVKDFLDFLEKKMLAKALRELKLLKDNGRDLKELHVKYMKNELYVLRIKAGSGIFRIFYFFFSNEDIILTSGFIKKTKNPPKKEFDKSPEYRDGHLRRYKNEI
jgi:phage-related protein